MTFFDKLQLDSEHQRKFQPILVYFGDLDPESVLEDEDLVDDLVNMAAPKDKVVMSVFVKQVLRPQIMSMKDSQSVANSTRFTTQKYFRNGVLRLCNGALCSSAYPSLGKPTCNDLGELIKTMVPKGQPIKQLDLSCNTLMSCDVKIIRETIEKCDAYFSDRFVLQLRRNQIQGVGVYQQEVRDEIINLVNMSKLVFLELAGNQFCTVDCKDFFLQIAVDSTLSEKLIWISDYNVATHGWRIMVSGDQVADQVEKHHNLYYAQLDRAGNFIDYAKQ
ncbi:hypothetical protein MP228_003036 [Amoeboaphelidium protococcarum]|nr:hypothetical protein MP228_003036 [Amoeboaphelidium protococcarum]